MENVVVNRNVPFALLKNMNWLKKKLCKCMIKIYAQVFHLEVKSISKKNKQKKRFKTANL